MSEDTRPVPYSLRLEPETRARLEALAKANGRSLNAQIIMMRCAVSSIEFVI